MKAIVGCTAVISLMALYIGIYAPVLEIVAYSKDLEIPLEMFQANLIFGDQKLGDLINIGMESKESKEWFGNSPPDLTLEAGLRGPDWIYTYLKSFYIDDSRPLGVNNKVYENVSMPNIGSVPDTCAMRQVGFRPVCD